MKIYMPTRGRTDNQVTLSLLPDCLLKDLTIVCHPGEEKELNSIWGSKVEKVIPLQAEHIGEVRQKCIDMSSTDYIIFVDDSLNFYVRAESEKGIKTKYPLKTISDKHFYPNTQQKHHFEMFKWIENKIKTGEYGMAGISRRSSNAFNLDSDFEENTRLFSFWGINRVLLRKLPGRPTFTDMQLKEDFYIALHFLTNKIKTIASYKYAHGRVGGANSKGGCSIYRTLQASNESAYELKEHFPAYITLRQKPTKSWGGEFGNKTVDVIVHTKKAFEHGKNEIQKGLF